MTCMMQLSWAKSQPLSLCALIELSGLWEGSFMDISGWQKILFVPKTSMRKQPIFRDTTTGFPLKWRRRKMRRNSTLMTCLNDVLLPRSRSASDWSCQVANLLQPISSISQIWVVTRHQYRICACEVVLQTSFGRETNNGVAKSLP